jgi:FAD/FMN-containing dehydrogenase
LDLITAEGRKLHVDEELNADLFWGIRGAGANFGVVTSFSFRLHPVGPMITQGIAIYPIQRAQDVAGVFRELAGSAPDEVMLSMGFGTATPESDYPPEIAGRPIVIFGATHSSSLVDADRDLRPLRQFHPVLDTFGPKSYLSVQAMNDDAMAWGKRFYMRGAFMRMLHDEAVGACVEQVASTPGDCSISLWAQGGSIARVPEAAMAFRGREAAFWLGAEAFWEDEALDAPHVAWGRTAMEALKPFTRSGHYVNDVVESGVGVVRAIYGDVKYERLIGLKRAYDPDNVFRLNQNVVP